MSIKKINAALIAGYQALALGLPTYYETRDDIIGTPRLDGHYASVYLLSPNRLPVTLGEGGEDEITGVFQIDFHTPENQGTGDLHDYADAACLYFVAGQGLTYLGQKVVITRATPSAIYRSSVDGTFAISVSVYYRARLVRGALAVGGTTIPVQAEVAPSFEFVQASPATVWTINHNLNRRVAVDVYNSGGQEVIADVQNTTLNQTVVTFITPTAGYAIIN